MHSTHLIRLQVVIPFTQPLSATDEVMHDALQRCYMPILEALENAENVRLTMHFGGHLLDYLARKQEPFMLRLKNLVKRGQLEILGGLFYGAIPSLISESDLRGQIEMSCEFWDSYVGMIPSGFWLPELSWSSELPRLIDETGLEYGFVSDTQLQNHHLYPQYTSLGIFERANQRLSAFVLNDELSQALPATGVEAWCKRAAGHGEKTPHRLVSVWVRAESLGWDPGTQKWLQEHNWLTTFFQALGAGEIFEPVLPQEMFAEIKPCPTLRLGASMPIELQTLSYPDAISDWADYASEFVEVDTLWRRMLHTSDRLRQAIVRMEDENLEEAWSDKLATAQRLLFSAQMPDVYWRGAQPGFSDPALREATYTRLARADEILDGLQHPSEEKTWLTVQNEDRDADGVDEVFVSTPHLHAWLNLQRGGELRTLEHRSWSRNILDVGSRRDDPFLEALTKHQNLLPTQPSTPPRRGQLCQPAPQSKPWSVQTDVAHRRGERLWIVEPDVSEQKLLRGEAEDLRLHNAGWDTLRNGIDEIADDSYILAQIGGFDLRGSGKRHLEIQRDLHIERDKAQINSIYRLSHSGSVPVRWAMELPVRLGAPPYTLFVNGNKVDLQKGSVQDARQIRLQAADGETLTWDFQVEESIRVDLWYLQLDATIRDLNQFRAVTQGVVLMPTFLLQGDASVSVQFKMAPKNDH